MENRRQFQRFDEGCCCQVKRENKKQERPEELLYKTHPAFEEDRKRDALRRLEEPFSKRSVAIQLVVFGLVFLLWKLPLLNPVKLLVVLFHELSHVLVAYLTGGQVFGIAIDPGGAGITLGLGGNQILILAAGYAGSLAIVWLLYTLSAVWRADEVWGVLFLLCCLSLVFHWLNEFTAFFGYGTLFLMFLGFAVLPDETRKFLLRLVATTCCLYPVIDIAGEVFQKRAEGFKIGGAPVGSDIMRLAALTNIPAVLLTFFWVMAGLVIAVYLIHWSARKDAEVEVKRSLFRPRKRMRFEHPIYDPCDSSTIQEYIIR